MTFSRVGVSNRDSERLRVLGAAVLIVLLAFLAAAAAASGSAVKVWAAANNGFAPVQLGANGLPKLKYHGTITFAANTYSPALKGVKLAPGQKASTQMRAAANAFHKMYPGVTIKFVPTSAEIGTSQWYITESAAGSLPDVSFVPGYYVNVTLPKGIYQNLLPSFEQPNPFIPGNKKWISSMNPGAVHLDTVPGTTAGSSGVYVINGDWAGIGFWYNKNLFSEAGLTNPPSSFNQLVTDSQQIDQKLKSKNVYAGGSYSPVIYNWFAHWFQANFLGLNKMQKFFNVPANLQSGVEPYYYSHGGSWANPSDNPKLTAWFPLGKELTDTWAPKDVQVPENTSSGVEPDGSQMLLAGQIAYCFCQGYSLPGEVASLPKDQQFPLGYFNLTNFKGSSKYATGLSVWQDNGGPATGFQFGIASSKSDSSMTPQKAAAARAWLQFISTPKWDSNIVNEYSSALPIIKGAKAPAVLEPTLKDLNTESKYYYPMALFDSITNSSFAVIDGLYLRYIDGYISFADAKQEYDQDADRIMQQWTAQNQPLLNNVIKWEKSHPSGTLGGSQVGGPGS